MKDTDIAYAAGLIDGEACIRIKKRQAKGRVTPGYTAAIQIRMVDEPAIKFIRDTFGGNYYREKTVYANRRPLYCFSACDQKAERILRFILPYLLVKKASALNAIALIELKRTSYRHRTKPNGFRNFPNQYVNRPICNRILSDEYVAECEKLYLRSKFLNRVGDEAMSQESPL